MDSFFVFLVPISVVLSVGSLFLPDRCLFFATASKRTWLKGFFFWGLVALTAFLGFTVTGDFAIDASALQIIKVAFGLFVALTAFAVYRLRKKSSQ